MRLTTALNEYKRTRTGRFPEEVPTADGAFSGSADRLVHVGERGSLRDHSDALSGRYGLDRCRLGILLENDTRWFDDLETIRQHYYRDTNLVETEYDAGAFTVHQYDLTLGSAHATHVELRGAVPAEAQLVAFVTFAPEGKESRVGALLHEGDGSDRSRALEVYHRREHDYLTASTGLDDVAGQRPERFAELLGDAPVEFPRRRPTEQHEQTRLSGDFLVTAPLERAGRSSRTTLVTQLSDHDEISREAALTTLQRCARTHDSADDLRDAALERAPAVDVPADAPRADALREDLRALDLLRGPLGGHIAAPEFDPFYAHSGGYGYVWFRDDAASADHLLAASDRLGLDTLDELAETARFLCDAQLDDGTWPQRVWASDGSLAPGWANANVEQNEASPEYQADQTATATRFLATLLRERRDELDGELTVAVRDAVTAAVDAMVADLAGNGLPESCQNIWEDSLGQFAHTAATFVEGFAAAARAPLPDETVAVAREGADVVVDGFDELWDDELGAYVMRLVDGEPDARLDGAALELAAAHAEYDALPGAALTDDHLDSLESHVSTSLNRLFRNPRESHVAGLVRYEGDRWRTAEQDDAKVWSVTTAMGALAAARTSALLEAYGRNGAAYRDRASDLYELIARDGPLASDVGYLAEQAFDDGTLDSGMPLGWSHALRLHATAMLADLNALPTTAAETEGPSEHPSWTTGEKYGVQTAADHYGEDPSRLWFTLTEGALTEARFPQVDLMNLRTLDFLVRCRDGSGYTTRTHRESRDLTDTVERRVEPVDSETLRFRHVFSERGDGRGHEWTLTVDYAVDPEHDALLADVDFEAADDNEYDVFAVADVALTSTITTDRGLVYGDEGAYHLAARDPRAYTAETDNPLLVDEDGDAYSVALAMATESGFDWATVGEAGSERLNAIFAEDDLPERRSEVDHENVLLVGRLGTGTDVGETVAMGFARYANTAAALGEAGGALDRGFDTVSDAYDATWNDYLADKPLPDSVADDPELADQYRSALMVLLAVEDKTYHGASIASPSVPWGEAVVASEARGYGYNFVWSRDLYQVFTAFETVGALDVAQRQLEYIYANQQDENGFIPQNTYVNGETRWGGEQMDNISFPQVMAYHLAEHGVTFETAEYDYENVRRSADYVARNGPATAQERWEEESGYSPSSIAAEIAGLACAAKLALDTGHDADALVWLALADQWTNNVDDWTATETGTDRHQNTPYYVRITRDGDPEAGHHRTLANDGPTLDERDVIDGGFLDLVRLGVLPVDETVRNSVREVDDTIRVEMGPGAGFYRYNGDGYGERKRGDQGAPWTVENAGKGRVWPLLTGERGEYALRADDDDLTPELCLRTIQHFANSGRMLPEQVWDREHGTDYGWEIGQGTGSATPLAWAMAQYVRLAHGISAGRPVETPAFVEERYREHRAHEPERSPALRVDTHFQGNELVVSGETTGTRVAVKTPVDSAFVPADGGTFEVTLDVEPGENLVLVAAAGDDDLSSAGTTVQRLRL